ncbi:ATP-binding protein [Solirubrobacter ginsenosidimutans]|uniref:histidine kinase n=1 Tax=Solirubrobacter ginsenosidimutans TaxID=490573 RepID=A0A9X3SAM2_9ACTN|nr:ATP-binding protein [Solirubrobacter ginsenosidimutans]MDA0166168.1 ATP-binding protein [Solirubrobacter ginsenosidimutans]
MSRMPLRFKLTLAFTGVMAVLLTGAGIALSLLVAENLDSTIDDGLAARAGDAAAVVGARTGQAKLANTGETFAQVLDGTGKVVDTTPSAGEASLLDRASLAKAREGIVTVERRTDDGAAIRLLARPVTAENTQEIVVVGEPLAQRERALGALHALLAIGGPIALLIASFVGYILAAAALRPVERMRRHAAAVTAAGTSERLPVPPTNDEIGRLGRTLNEMLARLEVAFKRERAFVSDASHELRTPLAILRTELELALRGKHTQEELEDALRSAAEESERLSGLADDLLVIARSDQGRLPVRPEPLEAGEVLARVAGRFQTRARAEGRPLTADPSPGVTVNADLARIEQALANLVDNALTYGHGTVQLSARTENGHVELHVYDEGRGFPPDFLPRAFERFTRADEARTRGGTGLGLAIAAAVAGAHGGSAHAENIEGGADVWIALPS